MSQDHTGPKYPGETGERLDGRNLINEWVNKHSNSLYVWKKTAFDQIDVEKTDHVMGEVLFVHFIQERMSWITL